MGISISVQLLVAAMHGARTLLRGIGLDEALSRACFLELWGEPCKLGEMLVDDAYLRCELVVVDVLGQVASSVA